MSAKYTHTQNQFILLYNEHSTADMQADYELIGSVWMFYIFNLKIEKIWAVEGGHACGCCGVQKVS